MIKMINRVYMVKMIFGFCNGFFELLGLGNENFRGVFFAGEFFYLFGMTTLYVSCGDGNLVNQVRGVLINYGYVWPASLVYQPYEWLRVDLVSHVVTVVKRPQLGARGVAVSSSIDLSNRLVAAGGSVSAGSPSVFIPAYLIYNQPSRLLDWYTINYSGSLSGGVNWFADVELGAFELLPTSPVKTVAIQAGATITELSGMRYYGNLEVFDINNFATSSGDLVFTATDFPKLQELYLSNVAVPGTLSLEIPSLTHLWLSSGSYGSLSIGSNAIIYFVDDTLALTQAQVDAVLFALNGNGLSNGGCTLNALGTATASLSGSDAILELEGKGWTVLVN